jgi:hypothetical protein
MKNKGFENGNVVPIVCGNVQSYWTPMPNEERQRDLRVYHVLNTGMADSAMKTYLEAKYVERLQRRKRWAARLAALTRG